MPRFCAHLSLVILLCMSLNAFAETSCCVPIRLDINAKQLSGDRMALTIKLTNTGKESLRFSNGFGPWAGPGQVRLVAIKLPGGEPIDNQLRAMVDPALGPVDLAPGKGLEYDVPLDELYRELAIERRKGKGDVVLFWTYQLITLDSKRSERVGGWLTIHGKD